MSTQEIVFALVMRQIPPRAEPLTGEETLVSLGYDSLGFMELVLDIEEKTGAVIAELAMDGVHTVNELVAAAKEAL